MLPYDFKLKFPQLLENVLYQALMMGQFEFGTLTQVHVESSLEIQVGRRSRLPPMANALS